MIRNTIIEKTLPVLPKGWMWTRLENCIDILDSQRVPVNAEERERRKGDIPYYGATGRVGWINDYLFDEELVLLGEDGAPFFEPTKNKTYIIRGKSWVNNHAHVLRAITGVTLNPFICHYLNTFDYNGYVTGTTRPKLNQSPMRKIPLPLPPLPEQHRIVAKIEGLFTKLDAGVGALKKVKAEFKRYRQAVLKYAFEGKLTEEWREANKGKIEPASVLLERIKEEREKEAKGKFKELPAVDTSDLPELPDGWVWTWLGDTADFKNGINFTKHQKGDKGILTIDVLNMYSKGIFVDLYNLYRVDKPVNEDYLLKYGDVLFVRSSVKREGVGWTSAFKDINEPVTFCGFIIRARPRDQSILPEYVTYFLRTDSARGLIVSKGSQVTITNINQDSLGKTPVPLAPFLEQHQIVEEIERRFSVADEVEKVVDQSLKQAERMRQSILKRAFEGKLVPQDPNDEPAERLLARITVERAINKLQKGE